MKNSKKDKKIKSKKTISQKITRINTTSTIQHGEAELNPKDKKVKWIFGGVLLSLAAIGIGVPLGVSTSQYQAQKAYDPNDKVLPDITVDDLINDLDKDNEVINKKIERIENIIVQTLYNQERDAFLKFEAFVNATKYKDSSNKVGATSFGVDVSKPFKEIWSAQEKKLEVAKKAMRQSNPTNWQAKWDSELQTNTLYGKANNDKEAIDYMTKIIAKEAAYARFNTAAINTDKWTESDLSLIARDDIFYKDVNDKEQKIASGTKLFSDPIFGKQNFLNASGSNIGIPTNKDPITPPSEVKIAVYESKSYVLSERNPLNRLPEIYNKYYKSANISSLAIPIVKNKESDAFSWTLKKETLNKFFTITRNANGKLLIPIDEISSFQGANTNSVLDPSSERMNTDKAVINTMEASSDASTRATETSGSGLGSSKASSLAVLIKEQENTLRDFNIAALSSEVNPDEEKGIFKIKQDNPISKFLLSIFNSPTTNNIPQINKLIEHFKKVITISDTGITINLGSAWTISKFNNETNKLITAIPEEGFNVWSSALLEDAFKDEDPYKDFKNKPTTKPDDMKWSVYELSRDKTYLYVNDKEMRVYNKENIDGDTAEKMLKNDIQNTIDVISNPDQKVLYDIAGQYNKITDNNIILRILMSEMKDDIIKDLMNPKLLDESSTEIGLTEEESNEMFNESLAKIIANINDKINPDVKDALTDIPKLVDALIAPMNSYDFFVDKVPNEINDLKLMNDVDYSQNITLSGKRQIYIQFYNKLQKLISINKLVGGK